MYLGRGQRDATFGSGSSVDTEEAVDQEEEDMVGARATATLQSEMHREWWGLRAGRSDGRT